MTTTTTWSRIRCQKCQLSVAMRTQSEFSNGCLSQFGAIGFLNAALFVFQIRQVMNTVGTVFGTIDTDSGTCSEYTRFFSKVKNDWLWCKKSALKKKVATLVTWILQQKSLTVKLATALERSFFSMHFFFFEEVKFSRFLS